MAEAGPAEIPHEVQLALVTLSKQLSLSRKGRVISPALATTDDLSGYTEQSSHSLHKASEPGVLCLDIHPSNPDLVITGGVDKVAVLYDRCTGEEIGNLIGHSEKVTSVLFHPKQGAVLTGSADNTVRLWTGTSVGYDTSYDIRTHTGEVTGVDLHSSRDYFVSSSLDETWGFHDLHTGSTLLHLRNDKALACIQFHPDGLLVGTGTSDAMIQMWDVKKGENVVSFSGHEGRVNSISFSENGFFMASCSDDKTIKMWDLRKLKEFQSFTYSDSYATPQSVRFDWSGSYLAAAGDDVRIFVAKTFEEVAHYPGHSNLVTDVKFGPDALWLASTSMDASLKIWGSS